MTLGIPEWTKANHNDLAAIAHRIQIGIYRTRPSDYSGSHRNLRYRWAQDCAGSSAVEPSNVMRILIEPFVKAFYSLKQPWSSLYFLVVRVVLGIGAVRGKLNGSSTVIVASWWVVVAGGLCPIASLSGLNNVCLAKLTFPGTLHLMPMVTKVTEMSLSWYLTLELHVQYYMGWLLLR